MLKFTKIFMTTYHFNLNYFFKGWDDATLEGSSLLLLDVRQAAHSGGVGRIYRVDGHQLRLQRVGCAPLCVVVHEDHGQGVGGDRPVEDGQVYDVGQVKNSFIFPCKRCKSTIFF